MVFVWYERTVPPFAWRDAREALRSSRDLFPPLRARADGGVLLADGVDPHVNTGGRAPQVGARPFASVPVNARTGLHPHPLEGAMQRKLTLRLEDLTVDSF